MHKTSRFFKDIVYKHVSNVKYDLVVSRKHQSKSRSIEINKEKIERSAK